MDAKTCYFASYRMIPKKKYSELQRELMFKIIELIHEGVCCFYTRNIPGFDMMAALTVLNIKKWFPHIKLIFALPYKDQTKDRSNADKKIHNHILDQADMVAYLSEDCQRLDDDSEVHVCYLANAKDSAAYSVNCVKRQAVGLDF